MTSKQAKRVYQLLQGFLTSCAFVCVCVFVRAHHRLWQYVDAQGDFQIHNIKYTAVLRKLPTLKCRSQTRN